MFEEERQVKIEKVEVIGDKKDKKKERRKRAIETEIVR